MALKVTVVELGPVKVQVTSASAATAADVIAKPVGKPPCNADERFLQFVTATPKALLSLRAA